MRWIKWKIRRGDLRSRLAGAVIASLAFCLPSAAADEGLELLHSDRLIGWDYTGTEGWTITDGSLAGSAEAKPLLSGFAVGDFRLMVSASGSPGAVLAVRLHELGRDNVIEAPLRIAAPMAGTSPQRIAIVRHGGQLTAAGDRHAVPPAARFAFGLRVLSGDVLITELRLIEPAGNLIINGTDLAGWQPPAGARSWRVARDGTLVKDKVDDEEASAGYLRTEKSFGNFTLTLQYKIQPGGNSGIAIRTPTEGWPSTEGFELQILDRTDVSGSACMALYRNVAPVAVAHYSGKWNHVTVKTEGRLISAWMNGCLVQHVDTSRHPELRHRHLRGWIGLQDHRDWIAFRDIRVLVAPDGTGLAAWNSSDERRNGLHALDRLMNTERLARVDGIVSKRFAATPQAGREELADLEGPGALVRIATNVRNGCLEFVADGGESPRFSCRAAEIGDVLPVINGRMTDGKKRWLTWVPVRKRMQIFASGPPSGSYWFTYLQFPEGTPVAPSPDSLESFSREWWPALDYRSFQHRYGTLRRHDPYSHVDATAPQVEAQQRVELLSLQSAGVVYWLRLEGGETLISSNDLWLEITVDGEAFPSIACPVRMWNAPLVGGVGHRSFLATASDGFVNRLAIPYNNGLTIAVHNRGTRTFTNVGVTASFTAVPLDAESTHRKRGRLKTGYAAANGNKRSIQLNGKGRLVGLIVDGDLQAKPFLSSLSIDGKPQTVWNRASLEDVFGTTASTSAGQYDLLSGQDGGMAWRYFVLAPIEFSSSLSVDFSQSSRMHRLLLYYQQPDEGLTRADKNEDQPNCAD